MKRILNSQLNNKTYNSIMNTKVIFSYLIALLISTTLFISCDDNNGADPTPPSVTAPQSVNIEAAGRETDLTFSVNIQGGYQSASVTASNGDASITSEPSSGATSGDVIVNFVSTSSGAGSVTLTVTDQDGLKDDATAVVSIGEEQTTIRVTDNITSDQIWETGKTYILAGRITVEAGATLTIEPGVVVKGEAGSGANSTALLVARDGTLNANGEAGAPIIFTSVADEITPEQVAMGDFTSPNLDPDINGLWGGVIVLGNAPISAASGTETQIEGIPSSDTNGLYGGDDPNDSSGSITYISIRHGGTNIGEGNEINGLTLGGVGSGTTIENIEVVANQDDGVEWFGGTVSVTNVLTWNVGDDGLDTDQAWSGTMDNAVVVSSAGSQFELDGPEGSFTSTGHTITNVSVYAKGQGGGNLIDVDANTDVNISNVLFFGLVVNEDGTAGNDFSSDYPDYAANTNGYAITSLEAIVPDTYTDANGDEQQANLALSDFFPNSLINDGEVTEVADLSSATVGADASVFGWTWASQSGALSSVGIE